MQLRWAWTQLVARLILGYAKQPGPEMRDFSGTSISPPPTDGLRPNRIHCIGRGWGVGRIAIPSPPTSRLEETVLPQCISRCITVCAIVRIIQKYLNCWQQEQRKRKVSRPFERIIFSYEQEKRAKLFRGKKFKLHDNLGRADSCLGNNWREI